MNSKLDKENDLISETVSSIEAAVAYIEKNYMNEFLIEDLLGISNLSKSYFFKLFKKKTGMSPFRYKKSVQLIQAKKFLEETDSSISQIAHDIGFEDQFYFSKIFKERYGYSPLEYRNNKVRGVTNGK